MKYLKIWTDFAKVMEPLQDDEKGRLFESMLLYAETGNEPESFAGNERFLWAVAKRDIDTAAERAEKLRENGMRGGRPRNQQYPTETKENQKEPTETKENQNEANESRKEKKRNERKGNEIEKKDSKEPQKRFTPPTVEEVRQYCTERNNGIDPEHFVDYYATRGWCLNNGKKVSDWKACVRTWEHNGFSNGRKPQNPAQEYEQRDYSNAQEEAIARMMAGKIPGVSA